MCEEGSYPSGNDCGAVHLWGPSVLAASE
jgi:hypothetical protein